MLKVRKMRLVLHASKFVVATPHRKRPTKKRDLGEIG
jgi:hypothetical protein